MGHNRIVRRSIGSDDSATRNDAPARRTDSARAGLPAERTSFVGRAAELAALRASVAEHRLTTITGPTGVGKSRLAVHAAWRWSRTFDEILLLDGRRSSVIDIATDLELLTIDPATGVAGHSCLVVIDHVDDDVDRIVERIDRLVDARSTVTVLYVGQLRLGVDGEHLIPLRPFAVPDAAATAPLGLLAREDAIALFIDRAAAVRSGFAIVERDRSALVSICRELGGLPLAIELAAERSRGLAITEIADQLATSLDLLEPAGAAAASRTRSLEARFADAAARCSVDERRVLTACAAFGDGIDLDALTEVATAIDVDPTTIAGIVSSLVDRSVLLPAPHSGRVSLPVVGRRFAAVGDDSDVSAIAWAAHAAIYRRRASTVRAEWFTLDQDALFDRLRADAVNIRVAIDRLIASGHPDSLAEAIQMLADLRFHWAGSAEYSFARDRLRLAARTQGLRPQDLLLALATTVYFELRAGDVNLAGELLEQATVLAAEAPATPAVASMLDYDSGVAALIMGDVDAAVRVLDDVVRTRTRADLPMSSDAGEAYFADAWARMLQASSGSDAAGELVTDFIAQAERGGDLWGQAYMMSISAMRSLDAGDPDRGLVDAIASLRVMDTLGDQSGAALFVRIVGVMECAVRRFDRAARLLSAPISTTHFQDALLRRYVDQAEATLRTAMSDRDRQRLRLQVADWTLSRTVAAALDKSTGGGADSAGPPRPAGGASAFSASATDALSPRELEIAGLVARGLANLAIAAHLVISRRTVEGHVQKILQKLSFTSRTQIAAWYVQYVEPRSGPLE